MMRLISQEANQALTVNTNAPANFGLVFNKWLLFDGDDFVVKQQKQPLLDSYAKSAKQVSALLAQRHIQQACYCQAMGELGWKSYIVHAKLSAPFVSGLGMAHPTETGLVLDHTTGAPYIPASSQKGVLRLAHMINSLQDGDGNWREITDLLNEGIVKKGKVEELLWQEDLASKTLFGHGGNTGALAGQLVVLDAYPLEQPALGEEILNPHFMAYYNGKRGPTEDQSPVPVKFLVVKAGAEFVFRLLLRQPLHQSLEKDQERLVSLIEKNLCRVLTEEGLGAKTSLGFGRFSVIEKTEAAKVLNWQMKDKKKQEILNFPWRAKAIPVIQAVSDYGQLMQAMDHSEVIAFQKEKEVAWALHNAAVLVRDKHPKKWDLERDGKVSEWLKPSGVSWVSTKASATTSFDVGEEEVIVQIKAIADWGAYRNSSLDLARLSKEALQVLRGRMRSDWKCAERRAPSKKKQALKEVNRLLAQKTS